MIISLSDYGLIPIPDRLVDSSRFNVVNEEGQRPFELATMRLQNMRDVLTHWRDLVPADEVPLACHFIAVTSFPSI